MSKLDCLHGGPASVGVARIDYVWIINELQQWKRLYQLRHHAVVTNNHCVHRKATVEEGDQKYRHGKEIRRKKHGQVQLEEDGNGSMRQLDGDE